MFTAALFTIARLWKQPKCPSVDKWIKKKWICAYVCKHTHTYKPTEILLSHEKE